MKKNKACGPDCLPIEVAKALGDEGAIWMTDVLNEAMREGIPEEWRTSTITYIYKHKGDPLECNNFRGIRVGWGNTPMRGDSGDRPLLILDVMYTEIIILCSLSLVLPSVALL